MGDDPATEERVRPLGPVEELVREDDVPWADLFAERPDGVDRDQALDSQLLEAEYVSTVVDLGREEPMALAVTGQKGHTAAFERPDDIGAGRVADCLLYTSPSPRD